METEICEVGVCVCMHCTHLWTVCTLRMCVCACVCVLFVQGVCELSVQHVYVCRCVCVCVGVCGCVWVCVGVQDAYVMIIVCKRCAYDFTSTSTLRMHCTYICDYLHMCNVVLCMYVCMLCTVTTVCEVLL